MDNIEFILIGVFCMLFGFYLYNVNPKKILKAKNNKSDFAKENWVRFSKFSGLFNFAIGIVALFLAIYYIITEW